MSRPTSQNHMVSDLEATDHGISCAEWSSLLCQLDPEEHRDRPAQRPTSAAPGSAEKIEVMAKRCAAGQDLFHPLDPIRQENPNALCSDTNDRTSAPAPASGDAAQQRGQDHDRHTPCDQPAADEDSDG